MPAAIPDGIVAAFQATLQECRDLYRENARRCAVEHPQLIRGSAAQFVALMDDLHRGLLIKTYVTVAQADRRWSVPEQQLAQILFQHVWDERLEGDDLRKTTLHIIEKATELRWYRLVRPFVELKPLRERTGDIETIVIRLANIVAKVDGHLSPSEARCLHSLQQELESHLRPLRLADAEAESEPDSQVLRHIRDDTADVRRRCDLEKHEAPMVAEIVDTAESLDDILKQLAELIGMDTVKTEVTSLTNFLKLQAERARAGLPQTTLSLHMVFAGNPGTGKTTVARIVGRIFGAMGILKRGHIIETDRSGLVAEYAGQTATKAQRKIDEALDGILFIDEAYSLVAEGDSDPYGHEALQVLLKRMEDDRQRLVVILAGYPDPMQRLLRANPGLSSRFNRQMVFDDYRPAELAQIFESLCDANQYRIPAEVRGKLLCGLTWTYQRRDEHFGNGRLIRNVFEDAIRRLANRIADQSPLTRELLTNLHADDIQLPNVPHDTWPQENKRRFLISCPNCNTRCAIPESSLGRRVRCRQCDHRFQAKWGEWNP